MNTRAYWVQSLSDIAFPVLEAMSRNGLKAEMPVEAVNAEERRVCTHLEALGRTVCGIAPWLEVRDLSGEEKTKQEKFIKLAQKALTNAVNIDAHDHLEFECSPQCLVDAAFLVQGILRAPTILWNALSKETQTNIITHVKSTRKIKPAHNNWLLFSGMIEAFLSFVGESDWDVMRIDYALRQHEQWYKGDGIYGDGSMFHWDYYNSFVIQPMMSDILRIVSTKDRDWEKYKESVGKRGMRYTEILERLIAPDGSFPVVGRSMAYRYGAFHQLAKAAFFHELPIQVEPAQVRCALDAVIHRVQGNPSMFDDRGWLTIGCVGHQPAIGEPYISTGSLYLCSTVF